ncbi:PaaI family thioesterase [Pseudothioclava nitratireducens]|uniref:PaaI family thioesterase n=1 Tax=Pseudothioclava nitratireducens TaxID=1928646 RepID=UPI0023DB632D|nr:PaaI family thioesterase [Defluviimonas nitratireducens]MDF1620016.1 PaaI family thioesterase [Defluviimonas nitratireducens]
MPDTTVTAPATPETDARIRASFAQQAMMETIGATLEDVTQGQVVISVPVQDQFRQQQGVAHAGLVFTLGDNAAGYAALSVMPPGVEVMTVEMKINMLAPGQGRLIAEGRVLKPGRRLVIVAADVWSEDATGVRKHVAALQGTMIPVTL